VLVYYCCFCYFAIFVSVAGYNLNNQQLKPELLKNLVLVELPAHHNLNNQQLKLVASYIQLVAGCLGYDVLALLLLRLVTVLSFSCWLFRLS
jgi:hypothetical protein